MSIHELKNIPSTDISPTDILPQKKVFLANDLVFKVIPKKPNLNDIQNIDTNESEVYASCMETIQACKSFLSDVEKRSFSEETFLFFQKKLREFVVELEYKASQSSPLAKEKLQRLFRGEIYTFLTQSNIASRAIAKPMGYPGDYVMLQYLYDNKSVSETTIGCCFDQFFLQDTLAKAVVNRLNRMARYLEEFIDSSEKSELHILNIASGSGFDLLPIAKKRHSKKVFFYCFDQEVASLYYAKTKLEALNVNTSFTFFKEDIRQFFKRKDYPQSFDLIYNIGLADYLPDKVLKVFMQESINALKPGGKFVLAHKDFEKFSPEHPAWIYDWHFIKRNYLDYLQFIKNNLTGFSDFTTFFESSLKVIYFGQFTM